MNFSLILSTGKVLKVLLLQILEFLNPLIPKGKDRISEPVYLQGWRKERVFSVVTLIKTHTGREVSILLAL